MAFFDVEADVEHFLARPDRLLLFELHIVAANQLKIDFVGVHVHSKVKLILYILRHILNVLAWILLGIHLTFLERTDQFRFKIIQIQLLCRRMDEVVHGTIKDLLSLFSCLIHFYFSVIIFIFVFMVSSLDKLLCSD